MLRWKLDALPNRSAFETTPRATEGPPVGRHWATGGKGAARVVGQRYRGAILGTRSGRVDPEHLPRIAAGLAACGIRPWELCGVLSLRDLRCVGRAPTADPPLGTRQA